MPLAELHVGLHLDRQAADPLPQVQLVGALVQKHAAALAGPGGAPAALIEIALGTVPVRDDPVGAADAAVLAGLHQLPHLAVDAVGALVEHQAEHHLRVLVRHLIHLPHLLGVYAGGLFHHHVDGALHALDGQPGVVVVGHGDDARVHEAAVQHGFGAVKEGHVLPQAFRRPLPAGGIDIRHCLQFKIGALAVHHRTGVAAAHVADADDA